MLFGLIKNKQDAVAVAGYVCGAAYLLYDPCGSQSEALTLVAELATIAPIAYYGIRNKMGPAILGTLLNTAISFAVSYDLSDNSWDHVNTKTYFLKDPTVDEKRSCIFRQNNYMTATAASLVMSHYLSFQDRLAAPGGWAAQVLFGAAPGENARQQ